ncbi:MAG: DUF1365 family protein [Miltoncostaeaceae bacterium]
MRPRAATRTPVRSALYEGTVLHRRSQPAEHVLSHRVCFYAIDLDEVAVLARRLRLFGHNRRAPFSLHDEDHAGRTDRPIKENVLALLAGHGIDTGGGRVVMVTNLRTFGYVFNPVSFFFCHDAAGPLAAVVAEVANTYGERHLYVLPAAEARAGRGGKLTWERDKRMHVSPFFGLDQRYRFILTEPGDTIRLAVGVDEGEDHVLWAEQTGTARPLSDAALVRALVRHPLMAQRVMGLIHWHALRLWLKRVPFHRLPRFRPGEGSLHEPTDTESIRPAAPGARRRTLRDLPPAGRSPLSPAARRLSEWVLTHPAVGRITLEMPDGTARRSGDPATGPDVTVTIASKDTWRRIARRGRIGLGEGYTAGDWYADDLVGLLEILTETGEAVRNSRPGRALMEVQRRRPHLPARADLPGARRDIQYHYDLGNDLYELFLDPSWTYSCAVFEHPGMTLQEAQEAKYRRIGSRLNLGPDSHVLEIGCGWGGFAEFAAREIGCKVTGLTISREQHDFARERIHKAGLAEKVDIKLQDYRDEQGRYDNIASIEMFEAVGEKYWPVFFGKVKECLKPNGTAALQIITINEDAFKLYRNRPDFIQRYIFPGGMLPTPEILRSLGAEQGLSFLRERAFPQDYARTLAEWRARFWASWEKIMPLGFDERFKKLWEFYLHYCEAGFRAEFIDVRQVVYKA